ncbi:MAG: DUF4065 domain-containing protein [Clostridia bacterium]|nr:DUF4065 domain-containing protein [Clostridia bacterium]
MVDGKLTVFDVANFFSAKEEMSRKKLQKLVYYAYAWFLALNNEDKDNISVRLFEGCEFQAWVHGPVCPQLYHHYSNNYGIVPRYEGELSSLINGELRKFLDTIYETFGKYTGDELETMTHLEAPWQNARDALPPYVASKKVISETDMFVYYNSI